MSCLVFIANGTDIDVWTFDELTRVVQDFQNSYGIPQQNVGNEVYANNYNNADDYNNGNKFQEQPFLDPNSEELKEGELRKEAFGSSSASSIAAEILDEISRRKQARLEKQYIKTKSVDDMATPLNKQRIEVVVSNGLVSEGGIFSASFITYKVATFG